MNLRTAIAVVALGGLPHVSLAQAPQTQELDEPLVALEREARDARRAVTLQEALKLAAKNNPDLQAARAQAAQVIAKSSQVTSAFLPDITLSLSYVHTTLEQKFDLQAQQQGLADAMVGALQTVGPAYGLSQMANPVVVQAFRDQIVGDPQDPMTIVARNNLYGSLIVQQVLFAPQFFLLPAAAYSDDAAKYGTLEAREQILLAVARVYLGLEGLDQLSNAAKDAEKVALNRERDAKAQVTMGMSTEINILRMQTETTQARATIATLAGQRVALLALLEALCGEPIRPVDGTPTNFDVTAQEASKEPWLGTYMIRASELGLRTAEQFSFVDNLTWLPSIVGQLKGGYNSNKGFAPSNFAFDAIVALQWQLYDRGVRYVNKRENAGKTWQARAQLDSARTKARSTWVGAKANLLAAQSALKQAESQAQLATRAQKQIESAFQSGVATGLEVSDIDSKRFFAQSAVAQARAQLEIRKVEMAAAEGRLAILLGLGESME